MSKKRWNRHRPLFSVPSESGGKKEPFAVLPVLWTILTRICCGIGAFVLTIILIAILSVNSVSPAKAPMLPGKIVLFLPLEGDLAEQPEQSFTGAPTGQPSVHQLVDMVDRAADDDRVKGIYARLNSGSFSLSRSDELRDAIKRFRAKGKFAYIYSSSYGEGGGDLGRYYLASAFGEIWMQPMGMVSIPGMRAEVPFFRNVLDKIGIYPQFYKRKEFKTAYESATNNEMSAPNRQEMEELVKDIRTQIMKVIPADRKIDAAKFEAMINKGLFMAPEAVEARLIDHSDYPDALVDRIKKDVAGDVNASDDLFVEPQAYMASASWQDDESSLIKGSFAFSRPSVALIYVKGLIMESPGDGGGLSGEGVAASDEIAPAIRDAADNDNIEAIVIRIDSPGGSPVASEEILRAIDKAKQKGKPIIVSMGPTAASGGYWIAAYADQIFAMPTTLTGSIGVLGGKLSGEQLWKKIGVNWDKSIQWGQNAGIWSMNTPFSATEAERINAMLDFVYKSFVERVAKGRGMKPEAVDKIAGGRVWTGTRAKEIGLVDQIGGMREAMEYTAQILGAKSRAGLNVVVLPKPKTALEKIADFLDNQESVVSGMQFQQKIFAYFQPVLSTFVGSNQPYAVYEPLRMK